MGDGRWPGFAQNACVAHDLMSRAALAGRRVTAASEWPLLAGAGLGLLAMGEVTARAPDELSSDITAPNLTTSLLLGLFATVPLALARGRLALAAMVITAATMLTQATGSPVTVGGTVAQVAVLYLVGLRRSRRFSLLLVALFAAYAIAPLGATDPEGGVEARRRAVLLLGLAAIATALGIARRMRREAAERVASRQEVAETLLEHAARGERARIARELHDVVAHHLSMIAVQAETARLTTPGMPAEGAKRLTAIGDTARDALTEMRRLLGVLREDAGTEPVTRRPQPGLAQLNDLLDEARDSAGASTRLILRGHVVPVDPGVALTAYRIVQEALTNARRHAAGAAVDVELSYSDNLLHVRVRDNGPGPAAGSSEAGHGLLGMQERAAMVGGTLSAGPGPVGGFLVEAALPTTTTEGLA
jgi:signal transduction histidine kinase